MISVAHLVTFAAYNAWQNRSLYGAADTLDDAARRADRGAFFRSIHGTLCHLLWADRIWLHRLAGQPKPDVGSIKDSAGMITDWDALKSARAETDGGITDWTAGLSAGDLTGHLTWYSGAIGREVSKPRWLLMAHMFNHQTHHRGQVHAMLTAAGARPDDTDLMITPGVPG